MHGVSPDPHVAQGYILTRCLPGTYSRIGMYRLTVQT